MFGIDKKNKLIEEQIQAQMTENILKYKRVFAGEDAKWVLEDLAKRSFEYISTYDEDEKKMCINEGRRSLYKHIKTMVEKDLSEILIEKTKE